MGKLKTIKALRSDEVVQTNTQILISNTYHLHIEPGEDVVSKSGGLNRFMNWPRPTMTDSGGFQVFSLGFGRDLGVGKVTKSFPAKLERLVEKNAQPNHVRITDEGVHFRSPFREKRCFSDRKNLSPFRRSLARTSFLRLMNVRRPVPRGPISWHQANARIAGPQECLRAKKSKQALYGIVQGSHFKDLRQESAQYHWRDGF